jgi:glycosyltransferase
MTTDKYNKGICRLLRLYITDSANLVFHFHYTQSRSLLSDIKKYFPLSKSIFTIHYLSWSERLQGKVSLFEKIIHRQYCKKIKEKYQHILDSYSKEKSFMEEGDQIVCLSENTLNLIQNQYHIKSKLWLIPNGLRRQYRNLSEKQKLSLREKYYIAKEEKILLFVGRINPIKGIFSLLSCFGNVVKNYPNCRLVIIGNGNINEAIKKCSKFWSKIIFTGRVDKKILYQWYQIADIALFPSFYEECSYVGIEMMMHGLPILSSDGYSVKNMFHDGLNAKVAKIGDAKNLSKFKDNLKEILLEMLNSDLSNLKKRVKNSYNTKYNIDSMQNGYLKLINQI